MQEKTNYGKIIAITIAIITATTAIAYVLYRLTRNLLAFCSSYEEDGEDDFLDFDEMEELSEDEDVNLFDEDEEAPVTE